MSRMMSQLLLLPLSLFLTACGIMVDKFSQAAGVGTPIEIEITAKPTSPTSETSASFAFTSVGASEFTCQVNNNAPVACSNSISISSLGVGEHRLIIRHGGSEIKTYSWTVVPPPVHLLAAGNTAPGYVHAFEVNTTTGNLTYKSKLDVGDWTNWTAISPDKKWAFVINMGPNTIVAVNLSNPASMTLVNSVTLATQPRTMAIHPTLNRVYVGDNLGSGSVYTLSYDTSTGSLQSIGSPIAAGSKPRDMHVTPDGKFLYVANWWSWDISRYSINQTTGELTSLGANQSTCGDPVGLDTNDDGTFLFVACSSSNNVGVYSINPTTGGLSAVPGSPFAGASASVFVKASPGGTHLISSGWDGTFTIFSLNNSTGALSAPSTSSVGGSDVNFSPDGKFVYVTAWGSPAPIRAFHWTSAGLGTEVSMSPLPSTFENGMCLRFW